MNKTNRKICIISDSFIPKKISAAGMLYNLSRAFVKRDIDVICIFGSSNSENWKINDNNIENYNLEKIKIISTNFLNSLREGSYLSRFIFEVFLSFSLSLKILKYRNLLKDVDLIIWYSPSAFLWLPCLILKKLSKANIYLILRDIFPDWLINIGLVKNKFIIQFLRLLTFPQLKIPNVIGCESKSDTEIIRQKYDRKNVETLYNWPSLTEEKKKIPSKYLKILDTYKNCPTKKLNILKGIYTGNNSISHDFQRGVNFLSAYYKTKGKKNLIINQFSSIDDLTISKKYYSRYFIKKKWEMVPDYILPNFFKLSDFGIVSLNTKHLTNNLPGKFISYIQFGLPVLCFANKKSELSEIIIKNKCGCVIDLNDEQEVNFKKLSKFIENLKIIKNNQGNNSKKLFNKFFSVNKAVSSLIQKL